MYHLAKSVYFWATAKEEYSILLLGLDNAGKTTLLSTIKSHYNHTPTPRHPTVPTVGQNVATIALDDLYLKIWDVGGQHALRSLWTNYYPVCHAIVFVVDGCDIGDDIALAPALNNNNNNDTDTASSVDTTPTPHSSSSAPHHQHTGRLTECRQTLEAVLSHPSTASVPLLVLANKQDREDCVETVRIKEGLVRRVFEGESGGGVRDSRVLPRELWGHPIGAGFLYGQDSHINTIEKNHTQDFSPTKIVTEMPPSPKLFNVAEKQPTNPFFSGASL
ncbi:P-loop containing nucleoside triphosphate hydrolase protein [Usnea florida]